jgi:phospholipase/carboxylesterase
MKFDLKVSEIAGENSSQAIVLLHGFGANRQDLAPLSKALRLKSSPTWLFPDAPETPPELALFGGRAWFSLDLSQIQMRAATPQGPLYDAAHVERLKTATDRYLSPWLWQLSERFESVVLGGFSQGAMMTLDWAWRHYDPHVKGLMLLSGAWPYHNAPENCRIPKGLPIFVSHGTGDTVLGFHHSQKMSSSLETMQAKLDTIHFPGGHEIPTNVLQRMQKFLDGLLES